MREGNDVHQQIDEAMGFDLYCYAQARELRAQTLKLLMAQLLHAIVGMTSGRKSGLAKLG